MKSHKIYILLFVSFVLISMIPYNASSEYIGNNLSFNYINKISVYTNIEEPAIMQWDKSTNNLHFYVNNNTLLLTCIVNYIQNTSETTSHNPGESIQLQLVLTGPNGLYIEYNPNASNTAIVPYRYWLGENETIYYIYYTFNLNYHIADIGQYDFRLYAYVDHDGLIDDRLEYYKLSWEVAPIYKVDNLFNDILPLIFVLITSASVSIISGKPNMLFFLTAFGMSWVIMIFTTLLPFWTIIIPVLLLVVLIFIRSNGGDNDE